jgi:hypothetical protein
MAQDQQEREFAKSVLIEAVRAGAHAATLVDVLNRAYTMRDAGNWTDPSAFVQHLQQAVPAFFRGGVAPQPEPPVTPTTGPVTRMPPPGVLLLSREDAKDAQKYRTAKAIAEKSGKRLEIEAS